MAKHHKAQLERFAQALAVGMKALETAKVAGYPQTKSAAANVRSWG